MNGVNRKQESWDLSSLARYISEIVSKKSGNILEESQQPMVMSRVKKRMLDLGLAEPNLYAEHLFAHQKQELEHLVSLLTTHHTFFFREFCHFEYIIENLHEIVERVKARGSNCIEIFSAACSRGHEVYSLSMLLDHHLKNYPGMRFRILGTDIDPASIKIAENGVYPYQEVKSIPQLYLSGNWQRGTGEISSFAKIKKHLKENCRFDTLNLFDLHLLPSSQKFDLILCRNVFIYFKPDDILSVVKGFSQLLYPGSELITGLSESLKLLETYKRSVGPSIYKFDEEPKSPSVTEEESSSVVEAITKSAGSSIPKPIRVLAVDDSKSILKLLKMIFEKDSAFELVGTAENGLEAEEFLKNNTVDAMTLDIHMPEMTGVEYLKKNFKKGHPHVLMISSASREDSRYASEALSSGACDFVEKPSLNNLSKRAEEIKNKLKMAFFNSAKTDVSIHKDFERNFSFKDVENKARVFFGCYSDLEKLKAVLNSLEGKQPATYFFLEGNANQLDIIKDTLSNGKLRSETFQDSGSNSADTIYICDLDSHFSVFKENSKLKRISFSIFGICSQNLFDNIADFECSQVLLEDIEGANETLKELVDDCFPWTSFPHVGTEFLTKGEHDD